MKRVANGSRPGHDVWGADDETRHDVGRNSPVTRHTFFV
jgi:hypothetical protein